MRPLLRKATLRAYKLRQIGTVLNACVVCEGSGWPQVVVVTVVDRVIVKAHAAHGVRDMHGVSHVSGEWST